MIVFSTAYSTLEGKPGILLAQELSLPKVHDAENQLVELRQRALDVIGHGEGLKISDIAQALGISTSLPQVVVEPLVGDDVIQRVRRRGPHTFRGPE